MGANTEKYHEIYLILCDFVCCNQWKPNIILTSPFIQKPKISHTLIWDTEINSLVYKMFGFALKQPQNFVTTDSYHAGGLQSNCKWNWTLILI